MTRDYHLQNRHAWNQAAAKYRDDIQQTVELLASGGHSMQSVELPFLADLATWCDRAIHLQCAGGRDTLSLLNLGAREVVGVDISEEMLDVAQATTCQLKANARWVHSDVLETPAELSGTADLVYTGRGAIIWIHDLAAWAETVARLLKPGGVFYMYEGHPMTYFFDMTAPELRFDPEFEGYFAGKVYESTDWPTSYIPTLDVAKEQMAKKYERAWPISEIINALLGAGLMLQRFEEYPDGYWAEFPGVPEGQRRRIPNTYSLCFRRAR